MSKAAVVTGAGSGVGRAVVLRLVSEGWKVALVGRREEALNETARLTDGAGTAGNVLVCPCDIGQPASVAAMAERVLKEFGTVEVLVNSAGTNVPKRSMTVLDWSDYRQVMDTNLDGALLCVQSFLAGMREQGSGTVVNIVSDAGLRASALAGAAYAMSKFGLAGLTQAINAEERGNGIRACAVFPGEINTPILDKRPTPPTEAARQRMLQSEDVAECVLLAINLPARAIVEELVVRPARS